MGAPAGPGGPAGSVTAHTPVLSKMAKSCDTDSQKYRKLMQWLQEDSKNLVPSALEKALEDHQSLLQQCLWADGSALGQLKSQPPREPQSATTESGRRGARAIARC